MNDQPDIHRISTGYNDPVTGRFLDKNPGRPLGSKNKAKKELSAALQDRAGNALAALDDLIAKSHPQAVLFTLEKGLPAHRTVQLHGLTPADIEAAVCEGAISPAEGKILAQTVVALKTVQDIESLSKRLESLETLLREGSV